MREPSGSLDSQTTQSEVGNRNRRFAPFPIHNPDNNTIGTVADLHLIITKCIIAGLQSPLAKLVANQAICNSVK